MKGPKPKYTSKKYVETSSAQIEQKNIKVGESEITPKLPTEITPTETRWLRASGETPHGHENPTPYS